MENTTATTARKFDMDKKLAQFRKAKIRYENSRVGSGQEYWDRMERLVAQAEAAGCLDEFVKHATAQPTN
jgi:hypothetical protein